MVNNRQRWIALCVLCLGVLMIVLDSTIVNIALPAIKSDLHFTEVSLVWVVNAYLLSFGGCLLLGGRLGDLFGHRRLFLIGLVLFTLASLACGVATTRTLLIVARAAQGIGGAIVDAVALSLIVVLFAREGERARAMGFYGFVCAAGGSIGVLLGGFLTGAFNWNWVFLVNVPVGIAVYLLCRALVPPDAGRDRTERLDVPGAVSVTLAMLLAVYAVVDGNDAGWLSAQTLGLLAGSLALLAGFVIIEARVAHPLVPLRLFGKRDLVLACVIGVFWASAMFVWFFIATLQMQLVLGYTPMQIGLAFMPSNIAMAILSIGVSARLVTRFGTKPPLVFGMVSAALGLFLFAQTPTDASFLVHVLPGMLVLGIGIGVGFNPLLMIAMGTVQQAEAGLASGLLNTGFMMGGALGLAILASLASARTDQLTQAGAAALQALNGGYHWAFMGGAIFAALASVLAFALSHAR